MAQEETLEREHYWRNVFLVQPGNDFRLFDTSKNYTQIRRTDNGDFGGMKSSIRVETGFIGRLNISLVAAPYARERYSIITPFDRDLGYSVDADDFSLPRRVMKINRMMREPGAATAGLYLLIFATYEDLALNGMLQALLQDESQLAENNIARMLRQLFLTLNFPNGISLTASASFNRQQRLLLFAPFFPSDTGPLPKVSSAAKTSPDISSNTDESLEIDKSEGFDILLPFEQAKVESIQGKFLVLPNAD